MAYRLKTMKTQRIVYILLAGLLSGSADNHRGSEPTPPTPPLSDSTSTLTMRLLSVSLLVAVCLAAYASGSNGTRPYELHIYRRGKTCSLTTLKKAQAYRGNAAYLSRSSMKDIGRGRGEDHLRFVLNTREDAWAHIETECGPPGSWEFPCLTDMSPLPLTGSQLSRELGVPAQQDILALLEPARRLFPLEFELEPLVKSGRSSNRVDLIFFADGCAYCYVVYQSCEKLIMSSKNPMQTHGLSETNSSKMPTAWQRISPATRLFTQ